MTPLANEFKYRNKILNALKSKRVHQLRYYTATNKCGGVTYHNECEYRALIKLKHEKKLHMLGRRKFGTTFEDGTKIEGVNITVIPFHDHTPEGLFNHV